MFSDYFECFYKGWVKSCPIGVSSEPCLDWDVPRSVSNKRVVVDGFASTILKNLMDQGWFLHTGND